MVRDALLECPDFNDFYSAVNDHCPFPWQSRLAEHVRDGDWPSLIGVPTGLGKTACVDIAIWALAAQAHLPPAKRTAPTRLWWVVNRRLLVDDTYNHAQRLAALLGTATRGELSAVATRLRALSGGEAPLEVVRLRGGVSAERPSSPAQPAVICSTIPMYGSRVLFRGYGSSRSTRPIDAALAYNDSLVICDEAHLATHLVGLFEQLADVDEGEAGLVLPDGRRRPKVVAVTATGDPDQTNRFGLDETDLAHSLVSQRLDTPKSVQVVTVPSPTESPGVIANRLVKEVKKLLSGKTPPASCLVFVNTPRTARAVEKKLAAKATQKTLSDPRVVMLTGRMREREADIVRKAVLEPHDGMRAGRERLDRQQHLIVVATQTLEVGADLDAEYMVTEACGVRALTQRLGRLNRFGEHSRTCGVYLHIPPSKATEKQNPKWRVYGEEPNAVLSRLRAAADPDGEVDLSPARLAEGLLGDPGDHLGRVPSISVGVLHEWVQSSIEVPGEAPVEPFFSGLSQPHRTVQIIWRAHLPDPDQRIWPPPTDREAIEIPVWEARDALAGDLELFRRVLSDGTVAAVPAEDGDTPDLGVGWTLIVRSDLGKMDEHGWNSEASAPVVDMSVISHGLPLHPEVFRVLYAEDDLPVDLDIVRTAAGEGEGGEPVDAVTRRKAALLLRNTLAGSPPKGYDPHEWKTLIDDLDPTPKTGHGEVWRLQRRTLPGSRIRLDAHDETSAAHDQSVGLEQHGDDAATFAARYANAVGIGENVALLVELAARWHDIGKADPRFQEWLRADDGPADGKLLAKSKTPRRRWQGHRAKAGWPKGGRHEALSGRLVRAWLDKRRNGFTPEQADLLEHLIVSHHGRGRPLILPVRDNTGTAPIAFSLQGDPVNTDADLSTVDWEQPRRFARLNHLYGYWGLALLETIVRQGDWAASDIGSEIR